MKSYSKSCIRSFVGYVLLNLEQYCMHIICMLPTTEAELLDGEYITKECVGYLLKTICEGQTRSSHCDSWRRDFLSQTWV